MKMKSNYLVGFLLVALIVAICVIVYAFVVKDSDSDSDSANTASTQKDYDYCAIYNACDDDFTFYSSRETAQQVIDSFEVAIPSGPAGCWEPRWLGCISKGDLTSGMQENQIDYCFAEIHNTQTGEVTPAYTGAPFPWHPDERRVTTRERIEQYIEEERQNDFDDPVDELAENEELKIFCTQEL